MPPRIRYGKNEFSLKGCPLGRTWLVFCKRIGNVAHAMVTKASSTQVSNVKYRKPHLSYQRLVKKSEWPITSMITSSTPAPCLPVLARINAGKKVKTVNLCINCLKPGHQVHHSKLSACRRCSFMHHSVKYFNQTDKTNLRPYEGLLSPAQSALLIAMTAINLPPAHSTSNCNEFVLLDTVIVLSRNYVGSLVPCRAILDSASQLHFIITRPASQLQV